MTTTAVDRASVRRVSGDSGNALRITRWHAGARRRTVHRVLDNGALVDLGSVVHVGARLCMAYPAAPDVAAFACDSFVSGARALDRLLEVETLTLYTVRLRTDSLVPTDPRQIDADATDMEA